MGRKDLQSNIIACKEAEEKRHYGDTCGSMSGLSKGSREASHNNVTDQHGACRRKEECATAEFIHAECCCDGKYKIPNL